MWEQCKLTWVGVNANEGGREGGCGMGIKIRLMCYLEAGKARFEHSLPKEEKRRLISKFDKMKQIKLVI